MQLFGCASVHPEYRRRWLTLFSLEIGHGCTVQPPGMCHPGTYAAGFPSMNRGSLTPVVPT